MQIKIKIEKEWLYLYQQNIFSLKDCYRDSKFHYIMIKGSSHQKDITIAIVYASNTGIQSM